LLATPAASCAYKQFNFLFPFVFPPLCCCFLIRVTGACEIETRGWYGKERTCSQGGELSWPGNFWYPPAAVPGFF
jgi:hypothetical protein